MYISLAIIWDILGQNTTVPNILAMSVPNSF